MFFKTIYEANPHTPTYSIDALYKGEPLTQPIQNYFNVITIRIDKLEAPKLPERLIPIYINLKTLVENTTVKCAYTEYHIPKSSGGYRLITAPDEDLKLIQRQIYNYLLMLGTCPHNVAYAYVPHRTCKDALTKHQEANNKWFYKFDIKDFFPSCTREVLINTLKYIYPFCAMDTSVLEKLIDISLYKGALPQGSPLSPLLSNMVLTSFDFYLYYSIKKFNGVYTRYADDIMISLPEKKELSFIQKIISRHLNNVSTNFKLNNEKSRCGSINGSNWNLGLMLNRDNQITIGHRRKMELKAKINNFIFDFTNRKHWSIIDTQVLQGEVNYFKQIEPEYATFVIERLEKKYRTRQTLSEMFRDIITGSV